VEKSLRSFKIAKNSTPIYGRPKTDSPKYGLDRRWIFPVDKVVDRLSEFFPQGS
jgi:hypothetical protein